MLEFGPLLFDCSRASLFKLAQDATMNEYYLKFMTLANRVIIEAPVAWLDCFISGLKDDIRQEVVAQNPVSLLRAVSLAKFFEEKYVTTFKSNYSPSHIKSHPQNSTFHTRNKQPPLLPTLTIRPTILAPLPSKCQKN